MSKREPVIKYTKVSTYIIKNVKQYFIIPKIRNKKKNPFPAFHKQ